MIDLHIDIETFSSEPIKDVGAYKYVESIDFEILLVAFAFNNDPVEIVDLAQGEELPDRFLNALHDPRVRKWAHNATFERISFRAYGIETKIEEWYCSAVKSSYCGLPIHLDAVSKALDLGSKGKLDSGKALIRYFSIPCKPTKINEGRVRNFPHHNLEKWNDFKKYCINDVEAERMIHLILDKYEILPFERHNYIVDQIINDRGILIDKTMAENAVEIDRIFCSALSDRVKELTGVENPGSLPQLKKWLGEAFGKEITGLAKDDITKLFKETEDETTIEVLKLRQKLSRTSNKKYKTMLGCICSDGRAHGLFQFYGAGRTGRFAGRLIQLQNLPQNHLDLLSETKDLVLNGDYEMLSMWYDDISDTLSQLIRTAFIAKPGHTFAVADFSAIEARVLAWLAGEIWRMDVFHGDGKIYEASASMMFNIPIEKVTKGSDYRAKGKIAELALGYQGSVGAMKSMDKGKSGLTDDEFKSIVRKWRKANPNIVRFWEDIEKRAFYALANGRPIRCKTCEITFDYDGKALTMQLPSGRKLFYWEAEFCENRFGKQAIRYKGLNDKRQWGWLDTYGGKFTENCIAGGTQVLTHKGWKTIERVLISDLLWDGFGWVKHEGLINKGVQDTMDIMGVWMTPDHEILTNKGWRDASQSQGLNRSEIPFYRSSKVRRFQWQEVILVVSVRLWKGIRNACYGIYEKEAEILRMQEGTFNIGETRKAQDVKPSSVSRMEIYEVSMHKPKTQSLGKLWGSWDNRMFRMVRKLRIFLEGYGRYLRERVNFGQKECERWILEKELSLGIDESSIEQPKTERLHKHSQGSNDSSPSFRYFWSKKNNDILSDKTSMAGEILTCESRLQKQVFDIKNSGHNNCFMVKGATGEKIIAHNCTQAVARDLLTETLSKLEDKKLETTMHVHDEAVCSTPIAEAENTLKVMEDIMSEVPDWAVGLPLVGDGYITPFYKKD